MITPGFGTDVFVYDCRFAELIRKKMKINCSTAECYGLVGLFPDTDETDEPVVLILDLSHALAGIENQFGMSAPENEAKMRAIRSFLRPGNTLYLPWVYASSGTIKYENGRHRTWGLAELAYQTVPVATMHKFAVRLQPYWGRIDVAQQEYDFTACEYPIVGVT